MALETSPHSSPQPEPVDAVRRRLLKIGMYLPPTILTLSLFSSQALANGKGQDSGGKTVG